VAGSAGKNDIPQLRIDSPSPSRGEGKSALIEECRKNKGFGGMTIAAARLDQIRALLDGTPFKGAELHPLAGDASFRRYIRVRKDGLAAMLMDAPPDKEDVGTFISVAEYLCGQGYSAPSILARDAGAGLLLLEDLGDDSFTSVLKREGGLERELYGAAIDVLVHWHDEAKGFSQPESLVLPAYNLELLMREVSLFTDWYLPQIMEAGKAEALRPEYLEIWRAILSGASLAENVWVHRDYHADNLMWLPERKHVQRVGLLDFQDGVYGDAAYDLVSLLEDARRDVPKDLAEAMIERYLENSGVDHEKFLSAYAILGAQRNSKIIGIFARLAVRDDKQGYLNYLPRVWGHLENDLAHPLLRPLKNWMDRHVPAQYRGVISIKEKL